jgi:hypothetical protein
MVMESFGSSTIIADSGFSQLSYRYPVGHVGYHNMLPNLGIIGILLFVVIIVKAFLLPYNLSKSKVLSVQSKQELRSSFLLLIAEFIIDTGTQTLGYTPSGGEYLF